MVRGKGKHLEHKKIKSCIIEYILEKSEEVPEPDIREYLKKKHEVQDQSTINKHLHDLESIGCIEKIPPIKMGLRNKWNVTKLKNLRNIRHEFSELSLHKYEKAVNIVLLELGYFDTSPDWVIYYLKFYMSASFFNTCIETGSQAVDERILKIYRDSKDSLRQQRIKNLLELCYSACVRHCSDFKASEEEFTSVMYAFSLPGISRSDLLFSLFKDYLHGLPKEIPQQIFKTQLSGIEGIPDKIPEEIDDKDLIKYVLNTLHLLEKQGRDFEDTKDDLLLEHFLHHDMLIGADSPEEIYFVNKTKENHSLPRGSTVPWQIILNEAELADLRLASEMIFKYKQPSRFSFSTVDEIYQAVLDYYSRWQVRL